MYFSSNASGGFQIWRQAFPKGSPEQLTFGPTEAEGLAVSPDGQSLYTSIGLSRQTIHVNVDGDDRAVSGEGDATFPMWGDGFPTSVFSADGKRIFHLVRSGQASRGAFGGGELWSYDLVRGIGEPVLPGLFVTSFDLSPGRTNGRVLGQSIRPARRTSGRRGSIDVHRRRCSFPARHSARCSAQRTMCTSGLRKAQSSICFVWSSAPGP